MAEIYGDKTRRSHAGDQRARWTPMTIGILIVAALIIALALWRG